MQLESDKKQVPHRLFVYLHKTRHRHQGLEETDPGRIPTAFGGAEALHGGWKNRISHWTGSTGFGATLHGGCKIRISHWRGSTGFGGALHGGCKLPGISHWTGSTVLHGWKIRISPWTGRIGRWAWTGLKFSDRDYKVQLQRCMQHMQDHVHIDLAIKYSSTNICSQIWCFNNSMAK